MLQTLVDEEPSTFTGPSSDDLDEIEDGDEDLDFGDMDSEE